MGPAGDAHVISRHGLESDIGGQYTTATVPPNGTGSITSSRWKHELKGSSKNPGYAITPCQEPPENVQPLRELPLCGHLRQCYYYPLGFYPLCYQPPKASYFLVGLLLVQPLPPKQQLHHHHLLAVELPPILRRHFHHFLGEVS